MTGRMKGFAAVALAASLVASDPLAGQGDRDIGVAPLAGIDFDAEELFVGLDVWWPLAVEGATGEIWLVPSLGYYPFLGGEVAGVSIDQSFWRIGADGVWAFDGESFAPFVRGGPVIGFASTDVPGAGRESNTDFGLNIAAGGFFGEPSGNRPYAQLGVILGDGSALYAMAAYRFGVGG